MLPEQEAVYTVHNAPKHLTKSYAICTWLEESLVACVMCALCSLAAIRPAVFQKVSRSEFTPTSFSFTEGVTTTLFYRDNLTLTSAGLVYHKTCTLFLDWVINFFVVWLILLKSKQCKAHIKEKPSLCLPRCFTNAQSRTVTVWLGRRRKKLLFSALIFKLFSRLEPKENIFKK